jgi:hypothetical protein
LKHVEQIESNEPSAFCRWGKAGRVEAMVARSSDGMRPFYAIRLSKDGQFGTLMGAKALPRAPEYKGICCNGSVSIVDFRAVDNGQNAGQTLL